MQPTWSVVVTTAPRPEPTLPACLESLEVCGWEPVVFAEPNSVPTSHLTFNHPVRLGVWHNWIASARYALSTGADYILTAQDDTDYHPDSREFIESIPWPQSAGFVSLYTPKHYTLRGKTSRPPGINRIVTNSLWGACALVWTRDTLEATLAHPLINSWLGASPRSRNAAVYATRAANPHMIANSDTAIGKIMNRLKYNMYFIDPSPCTHTAQFSAIGHGDNRGRRNAYRRADHSISLWDQVPHERRTT
jgi:hypothetical protein